MFVATVVVVIVVRADDTGVVSAKYESDVLPGVCVDCEDIDDAIDATDASENEVEKIQDSRFTSDAVTEEFSRAEIDALFWSRNVHVGFW